MSNSTSEICIVILHVLLSDLPNKYKLIQQSVQYKKK